MPPIAQRLREPAAFVLLAFGALSTLFNTITFLFNPGGNNNGLGGGPTFSQRAHDEVGNLLSVVVVAAVVGAVYLAHSPSHLKQAKVLTLMALITLGVADLFGVVALFSAFGADGATGWDKTSTFFVSLGELGVAAVGTWLVLGYFQQHQPAQPAGERFQPPQQQWGPGPGPQQQWQQPPAPQQQPQGQQQPWGPPPQQAPQPTGPQPPQPQWGQPQQQDADAMMTQAIPTVPPAQPGQHQQPGQHGQHQQHGQQGQQGQQPPQQDGGLGIGNWTSE